MKVDEKIAGLKSERDRKDSLINHYQNRLAEWIDIPHLKRKHRLSAFSKMDSNTLEEYTKKTYFAVVPFYALCIFIGAFWIYIMLGGIDWIYSVYEFFGINYFDFDKFNSDDPYLYWPAFLIPLGMIFFATFECKQNILDYKSLAGEAKDLHARVSVLFDEIKALDEDISNLKNNYSESEKERLIKTYNEMGIDENSFLFANGLDTYSFQKSNYSRSNAVDFHINISSDEAVPLSKNDIVRDKVVKLLSSVDIFGLSNGDYYYQAFIDVLGDYEKPETLDYKMILRSLNGFIDSKKLLNLSDNYKDLLGLEIAKVDRLDHEIVCLTFSKDAKLTGDDLQSFVDFDGSKLKKGFIYFGETSEGSYYLDIKKMTHFLVVGVSGSGKSVFLNNLITSVRFNNEMFNNICLADLKGGVEFFPYASEDIEKLDIIDGLDSLRIAVKKYLDIMRSNLESMKKRGLKKWDGGCELLLIDEYSLIQLYKPTEREEKANHAQLLSQLNILSAQGRAAGIRLIVGLQKSSTDNIDSSFKNNLQSQVCFKVKSALDVTSVFGSSDFKEELGINPLKFGKGRCLIYDDSIQEHKLVQVPFFDDNKVYRF